MLGAFLKQAALWLAVWLLASVCAAATWENLTRPRPNRRARS
jgi:hypothetical protein